MHTEETQSRTRTKLVRVPEDIAEKLAELIDACNVTSAEYLDPLIRRQIENDHKANQKAIESIRRAREAARASREQPFSNDLGEAGA